MHLPTPEQDRCRRPLGTFSIASVWTTRWDVVALSGLRQQCRETARPKAQSAANYVTEENDKLITSALSIVAAVRLGHVPAAGDRTAAQIARVGTCRPQREFITADVRPAVRASHTRFKSTNDPAISAAHKLSVIIEQTRSRWKWIRRIYVNHD